MVNLRVVRVITHSVVILVDIVNEKKKTSVVG